MEIISHGTQVLPGVFYTYSYDTRIYDTWITNKIKRYALPVSRNTHVSLENIKLFIKTYVITYIKMYVILGTSVFNMQYVEKTNAFKALNTDMFHWYTYTYKTISYFWNPTHYFN